MAGATSPKRVVIYANKTGKEPFTEWLNGLKNDNHRRCILMRLRRIELGNFGDSKHIQGGVYEFRLFIGPGFRIYYGKDGETTIVLLCGGNKSSQTREIKTALIYWQEYKAT